jgi:hypothetical protein
MAELTTAAEQRRLGREKRRDVVAGAQQTPEENPRRPDPRRELAELRNSVQERVQLTPSRAAVLVGAAAGVVAGVATSTARKNRHEGNVISGDVAIHLLNRIELLTIRLQVRHTARGAPSLIDVHRVEPDASSRSAPAD